MLIYYKLLINTLHLMLGVGRGGGEEVAIYGGSRLGVTLPYITMGAMHTWGEPE